MNDKFRNTQPPAEKEEFKRVSVPAVKKLIIEKFGPESEEMLNAFLQAVN